MSDMEELDLPELTAYDVHRHFMFEAFPRYYLREHLSRTVAYPECRDEWGIQYRMRGGKGIELVQCENGSYIIRRITNRKKDGKNVYTMKEEATGFAYSELWSAVATAADAAETMPIPENCI